MNKNYKIKEKILILINLINQMKIAQRQSVQSLPEFLPKQFSLQNILDKQAQECRQQLNALQKILIQEFELKQDNQEKRIKQTFKQLYIYRFSNEKIALFCLTLCFCGTNYLDYLVQKNKKNGNMSMIRKIIKQLSYTNIFNPISDIKNNLPDILTRLQLFKSQVFDELGTTQARQDFYNYLIRKQDRNQNQKQVCQSVADSIKKLHINFVYQSEDAFQIGELRKSQLMSKLGKQIRYNYLYLCPMTLDGTYNYWLICVQTVRPERQVELMDRQDFMNKPRFIRVQTREQEQENEAVRKQTIITTEQNQMTQKQIEFQEKEQMDKKESNDNSQQIIALLVLIISIIFCLYDKNCSQLVRQLYNFT